MTIDPKPQNAAGDSRTERSCRHCRYWHPPDERLVAAYDAYCSGTSKRRLKQPTGHCDQVLIAHGLPVSFSSTEPGFSCLNFEIADGITNTRGKGTITIYEGERVIWEGHETDLPPDL